MEGTNVDKRKMVCAVAACVLVLAVTVGSSLRAQEKARPAGNAVGIFEGHADVGKVMHAGAVEYDAAKQTYTIAASGENIWFDKDAFHFVWKKMSGDVTLTADVSRPE